MWPGSIQKDGLTATVRGMSRRSSERKVGSSHCKRQYDATQLSYEWLVKNLLNVLQAQILSTWVEAVSQMRVAFWVKAAWT